MKKMILLVAAVAGVSLLTMNGTAEAAWRGPMGPGFGVYGPGMFAPGYRVRGRAGFDRRPAFGPSRVRANVGRNRVRANVRTPGLPGPRMNLRAPGMRLRVR